uniref:Uncharacterized protein n=1 Tax=Nothobranchius rachovii TaxID=451742 RepID=A0A1A8Q8I7_9TELE
MKKFEILNKNATSLAASERSNCVDHMYDRHTFQFTCCIHKLANTSVHTSNASNRLKRSENFFHPEGESPSRKNPCLSAGSFPLLDWTRLWFNFPPPDLHYEHNSEFTDCSLPLTWSEDGHWTHFSDIKIIFSFLSSSCPFYPLFPLCLLYFCFGISFFLLVTAAVVFYESGGFFFYLGFL